MTEIARYIPIPNTEVSMPRPGFGVFMLDGDDCAKSCAEAVSNGYRHIDSALLYRNEAQVGKAIRQVAGKVPRQDLFLTTKLAKPQGSLDKTYQQLIKSVTDLSGGPEGYADLVLIHNPDCGRKGREELWLALEKLLKEGKAKSIGVSNYRVNHLEEMKEYATVWPPHVNQIELHPWCQQRELVQYCQKNNIILQAYSPLATAENMDDVTVKSLADKYNKSSAQILLRWGLQRGWVPLPKSQTPSRIKENIDIFGFALDEKDMETLNKLDKGPAGAIFTSNVSHGLK